MQGSRVSHGGIAVRVVLLLSRPLRSQLFFLFVHVFWSCLCCLVCMVGATVTSMASCTSTLLPNKRPRGKGPSGWLALRSAAGSLAASLTSREDMTAVLTVLTTLGVKECFVRGFSSEDAARRWLAASSPSLVESGDDVGVDHAGSPVSSQAKAAPADGGDQPLASCRPALCGLSYSNDFGRVARTILDRGEHVFITGGAGVGKTTLLRTLRAMHQASGGVPGAFAVVAPSGIAALSAGGVTGHTFFHLTPRDVRYGKDADSEALRLIEEGTVGSASIERIEHVDIFCVDEVSMVSAVMFSLMVAIIKLVKTRASKSMPQILAIGDFYQLPPVRPPHFPYTSVIDWAFLSPAWDELFHKQCVELTIVHRQQDPAFAAMLQALRVGTVTEDLRAACRAKAKQGDGREDEHADPTVICSLKENAQRHNVKCLMALSQAHGGVREFKSRDIVNMESPAGRRAGLHSLDTCLHVPAVLRVSLYSRVSYCGGGGQLADLGLVNGCSGIVMSFCRNSSWPVVRFNLGGGGTVDAVCEPVSFEVPSVLGGVLATRVQVPIHLSWAITVHRCQSISLDKVTVDLGKSFCHGMVYVALSRVRSLEGLYVMSFDERKVFVDGVVREFYDSLARL